MTAEQKQDWDYQEYVRAYNELAQKQGLAQFEADETTEEDLRDFYINSVVTTIREFAKNMLTASRWK